MKKKHGVMIYFDIKPCIKRLSKEQLGYLFEAILDYGEFGREPKFTDQMVGMAWDIIKQKLDNDDLKYKEKCARAQQSINSRWSNAKNNQNDIGKDDTNVYERIRSYTDEFERRRNIPTTTTTTTASTNSNSKKKEIDYFILQIEQSGLSQELQEAVKAWIKYKNEKKQGYKATGFNTLLSRITKKSIEYGDEAVIELIDECISSNYTGIVYDRLENKKEKSRGDDKTNAKSEGDNKRNDWNIPVHRLV